MCIAALHGNSGNSQQNATETCRKPNAYHKTSQQRTGWVACMETIGWWSHSSESAKNRFRMTSQPPSLQNGLFSPCRAVGLICGDVKPYLHTLGTENFIVTAVDKSFQVYAAGNLALRSVSAPVRKRIRWVPSRLTD
jgi:hypothetical protein